MKNFHHDKNLSEIAKNRENKSLNCHNNYIPVCYKKKKFPFAINSKTRKVQELYRFQVQNSADRLLSIASAVIVYRLIDFTVIRCQAQLEFDLITSRVNSTRTHTHTNTHTCNIAGIKLFISIPIELLPRHKYAYRCHTNKISLILSQLIAGACKPPFPASPLPSLIYLPIIPIAGGVALCLSLSLCLSLIRSYKSSLAATLIQVIHIHVCVCLCLNCAAFGSCSSILINCRLLFVFFFVSFQLQN